LAVLFLELVFGLFQVFYVTLDKWKNETVLKEAVCHCLKVSGFVFFSLVCWVYIIKSSEKVAGVFVFNLFYFLLDPLVLFLDLSYMFLGKSKANRYVW
jgi:hypothetical protein